MKLTLISLMALFFSFIAYPSYSISIPQANTKSHEPFLIEVYNCFELSMVVGSNPATGEAIAVVRDRINVDHLTTWQSIKIKSEELGRFYMHQVRKEEDCV